MIVDVVIPAWNEEESIGLVVGEIPKSLIRHIVVVDNNSRDKTSEVATRAGAIVLQETAQGYGAACLKGIEWINRQEPRCDVLVFMDADHSDYPDELHLILAPIKTGAADLVIGSRSLGQREKGSMTPQQVFGNWLATWMIRVIFGFRFTDLGPFRAIGMNAYNSLGMCDRNYGWTVEMQVKALKKGLRCTEVAVGYRRRIGVSKVSGTIKGTIGAGYKIITTILKYSLKK